MIKRIIAVFIITLSTGVYAWDDCPFGKHDGDGKYPGDCGRYVDTNHDGACDHSQAEPVIENKEEVNSEVNVLGKENQGERVEPLQKREKIYHLVPITLFLLIIYIITQWLLRKKIIKLILYRKIWNSMLLIVFLISGILGTLLVIKINFGLGDFLPFDIMFWHVEAGIAMFVMCIFHLIERRHFFLNMFR